LKATISKAEQIKIEVDGMLKRKNTTKNIPAPSD